MDTREKQLIVDWLKREEQEADLERVRAEQVSQAEDYADHELEVARHETNGFHMAMRYIRRTLEHNNPEYL